MIESICEKEHCTGCYGCADVCPRDCISFSTDEKGFIRPVIDGELCIECHRCQKVCPGRETLYGENEGELYVAYAKDAGARDAGSSGGVFGLLAGQVLEDGGTVYGAAFDESLSLRNIRVDSVAELPRLYKSKYIQSDAGGIYKSALADLKEGRKVLFCGTPCQCAAMKRISGSKYPNLLLVDFLCHGVPSQQLWHQAVDSYERKHNCKITAFSFRAKVDTKGDHYCTIRTRRDAEEKTAIMPSWKFPYYHNYTNYTLFRPSCYGCSYANPKRVTDITLGDFWHLPTILPETASDYKRGYSAVIVSTARGADFFDRISDRLWKRPMPLSDLKTLNPTLTHGTVYCALARESLDDLGQMPYSQLEEKYMIVKMDLMSRGIRFIKRHLKRIFKAD